MRATVRSFTKKTYQSRTRHAGSVVFCGSRAQGQLIINDKDMGKKLVVDLDSEALTELERQLSIINKATVRRSFSYL